MPVRRQFSDRAIQPGRSATISLPMMQRPLPAPSPVPVVTALERATFNRYLAAWSRLATASPLIVYRTKDGGTYCQLGLPPRDEFAKLVSELPSGRLAEFLSR